MEYRNVYFRIRSRYQYDSGWPDESDATEFREESRRLFQSADWDLHPGGDGISDTVTKGQQDLYLHPMNFSGIISLNGSPIWRTTPMRAAPSEEQRTKSWRRFLPSGRPPKKIWKMTLSCDSPHFSFHLYLPAPLRGRPATGIRRPRPAVLG